VVGDETVAGAQTTHIRATVNVAALLGDINTFLQKASSLGVSGASRLPTALSPATRQRIAGEVQSPTFDVWTGKNDKTVRRLTIGLTLPVTGAISTQLGGLRSAQIGLTMQYADLNQPQTIAAPTAVRPFTEFTSKLQTILGAVQGSLGGVAGTTGTGSLGSTGTTGSTPAPSTGSASSAQVQNYSQCIANAHGDVTKMQRCAALINSK
jgi:hypothetical protein